MHKRDYVIGKIYHNEIQYFFSQVYVLPRLALLSSSAHLLFPLKIDYSNPIFFPLTPVVSEKRNKKMNMLKKTFFDFFS